MTSGGGVDPRDRPRRATEGRTPPGRPARSPAARQDGRPALPRRPRSRTRVSFEAGIAQLGGHGLYLSSPDLQMQRGETIEDTSRVLARYVDAIMARVMQHETLTALAAGGLPTINGLSDLLPPDPGPLRHDDDPRTPRWLARPHAGLRRRCEQHAQLAPPRKGPRSASRCAPSARRRARPTPRSWPGRGDWRRGAARRSRSFTEPGEGVRGANIVYTDVWRNMGDPETMPVDDLIPYRVTDGLMDYARPDALFMHCMPLIRGRKSSPRWWTARSRSSSTRPKTACMCRRRCWWSNSASEANADASVTQTRRNDFNHREHGGHRERKLWRQRRSESDRLPAYFASFVSL